MPKWIDRWNVNSHTNPDKEYVVSRADDAETWGCSCPAWTFQRHRIRDGICKHIREVQATIEHMSPSEVLDSYDRQEHDIYPDHIKRDEFFTEEEFAL